MVDQIDLQASVITIPQHCKVHRRFISSYISSGFLDEDELFNKTTAKSGLDYEGWLDSVDVSIAKRHLKTVDINEDEIEPSNEDATDDEFGDDTFFEDIDDDQSSVS